MSVFEFVNAGQFLSLTVCIAELNLKFLCEGGENNYDNLHTELNDSFQLILTFNIC
jgi:hypothetical protein